MTKHIIGISMFAAVFGLVAAMASAQADGAASGQEIVNPPDVAAMNGSLEYTLTAAPAQITVAGQSFVSNVYNGTYTAPVFRLKRGDTLKIHFVNNIDASDMLIKAPEPSNLHYHGLNISPQEPSDNIYISIPSSRQSGPTAATQQMLKMDGAKPSDDKTSPTMADLVKTSPSYTYEWTVPDKHPQGIYWVHPHQNTEAQILSGMSGLLVIEGALEQHYPELAKAERRTLILKDIDLPGHADGSPKTKTINGILGGVMRTMPGEVEVWEIGNIGADSFFDLAVDGHKMWILGRDGNTAMRPELVESVYLPPASRALIAIQVGAAGTYGVRSLEVDTGSMGDPNPSVQIASFVVDGAPVDNTALVQRLAEPAAVPEEIEPSVETLKKATIARKRTVEYTETADGKNFFINGKAHEMSRIDYEATLGDVEEWTIVNKTDERHTFHIHQIDFLVTELNNSDEDATGLRDNIDIPPRDPVTGEPGQVTLILPFTDSAIVGKFPFHCHISEHGDNGMMANMLINP